MSGPEERGLSEQSHLDEILHEVAAIVVDHSGSKVLIVDDESRNIALLDRLLTRTGYANVRSTTDPLDGLRMWEEFEPDLLLLDLNMPVLDGFGFMDRVRSSRWMSQAGYVPILVLTGDASARTRDRALSSGARDFLTKPFDPTEVRLRINNLLETRSLHLGLAQANRTLEQRVRERTRALAESLQDLGAANTSLRLSRQETIERLSIAAELRDDDTGQHIHRMSGYAAVLARRAGFDDEEVNILQMATQMHDVGKIGIPDAVLLKPGKLTADERAVIETHAQIGHDILSGSEAELLSLAADIALTHHERFDGMGYPQRLAGEGIPIEGRIAAIADVFDAITNARVYRPAMTLPDAVAIMKDGRGTHFDPRLLDLFLDSLPELLALKEQVQR